MRSRVAYRAKPRLRVSHRATAQFDTQQLQKEVNKIQKDIGACMKASTPSSRTSANSINPHILAGHEGCGQEGGGQQEG